MIFCLTLFKFTNLYIEWFAFVGFITGYLAYRRYGFLWPITAVLLITFCNNHFASYGAKYYRSNVELYHFFNPIQFLLLSIFFYKNFKDKLFRKTVLYMTSAGLAFAVINSLFIQKIHSDPMNFMIVETLILIIYATLLFIERIDLPARVNIFTDPVFITTVAILCFNLFIFLFFLLTNYFWKHKIDQSTNLFWINYFSNFLYYPLLFIAGLFSLKKNNYSAEN
ncbi:hypothetical protein EGI32_16480 [Ferruginibacter sp. HRS2-29]|nr:hypothetical protein [Ferruginibacter sp. HRS2-29]